MHRFASNVFAFGLSLALLVAMGMLCFSVVRSSSVIPPLLAFSVGIGLYTLMVLYILHRRAGTLSPAPGEGRGHGHVAEGDGDMF